jgi:hypothetical protein
MLVLLAAFSVMAAAAEPATGSADVAAATAGAPKKTVVDPNAVVCHREEMPGTRMAKRVCESKEQADARRKDDRDSLGRMQNTALAPFQNDVIPPSAR